MNRPTLSWVVRRRTKRTALWVAVVALTPIWLCLGLSLFLKAGGL